MCFFSLFSSSTPSMTPVPLPGPAFLDPKTLQKIPCPLQLSVLSIKHRPGCPRYHSPFKPSGNRLIRMHVHHIHRAQSCVHEFPRVAPSANPESPTDDSAISASHRTLSAIMPSCHHHLLPTGTVASRLQTVIGKRYRYRSDYIFVIYFPVKGREVQLARQIAQEERRWH